MSHERAHDAEVRSAEDAVAWLRELIDVEKRPEWPYQRFSLSPIRALLARIGHPERGLPAVHIAGSKGKGSTALMTEAILEACGRRTGTFTSPHLERWTERFRVAGREPQCRPRRSIHDERSVDRRQRDTVTAVGEVRKVLDPKVT